MTTPYQTLDRLRARVEYEPSDIFDDADNAARFGFETAEAAGLADRLTSRE